MQASIVPYEFSSGRDVFPMPRHLASSGLVLFALVLTLAAAPAQAQAEDPVASDRKTYEKIGRFDAGQLKREQDTIRVEGNSFVDENGNNRWDTGNYATKKQPELVYYLPFKLTLRAFWEVEENWDYKSLPLLEQKPQELIKTSLSNKKK